MPDCVEVKPVAVGGRYEVTVIKAAAVGYMISMVPAVVPEALASVIVPRVEPAVDVSVV